MESVETLPRAFGLVNARVISIDRSDRIYEAVGIEGDRIVAVGDSAYVAAKLGPTAFLFDAKKRAVVPGLIDAHAHLDREGLKELLPSLSGAKSVDAVLERIASIVRQKKAGEWIVTMPAGEPPYYDPQSAPWPTRADLDHVAPDNPVYIRPAWGWWHGTPPLISVANSAALRAVGLQSEAWLEDSAVRLERNAAGELTGRIIEDMFMPVMELTRLRDPCRFTRQQRAAALRTSLKRYNAAGTTGIFEGHGVADEIIDLYRLLDREHTLSVRTHLVRSVPWHDFQRPRLERWLQSLDGKVRDILSPYLQIDDLAVELGRDPLDSLRAQGHPYTGWAGFYYNGGLPEAELEHLLSEILDLDLRPVSLGVGVLDLYWRVARFRPPHGRRWVVGHVGALSRDDIGHIRDLGACVTTHTNRFIYRQGCGFSGGPCPTRRAKAPPPRPANELVPLRSLAEAGVVFGLGSDNAPLSLFYPIWQAVARRCASCGRQIGAEECLTREQALRAATWGGAYICREEDIRGSVEVGKLADLVVLNADPLRVAEDALRDIMADITIVGGKLVHDRNNELSSFGGAEMCRIAQGE